MNVMLEHTDITSLTISQRASLAAKMKLREKRARKAWMKAARADAPVTTEPCNICGKYAGFTHAHHVVPLSEQYRRGAISPDHTVTPLCPTHHAIVHAYIDLLRGVGERRIDGIDPAEADACRRIAFIALGGDA